MESLITFLKWTWVWLISVAVGVWVFLNLPLDEFTWIGKTVSFIICVIVLPLVPHGIYSHILTDEKLSESFRNIRYGCVTFLLGVVLWNNLPLGEVSGWVKFLLGAILFAAFPLMVQVFFSSAEEKKKE